MPYVSCGHCRGLNYLPRSYLQAEVSCPVCGGPLDPGSYRPRAAPGVGSSAGAELVRRQRSAGAGRDGLERIAGRPAAGTRPTTR